MGRGAGKWYGRWAMRYEASGYWSMEAVHATDSEILLPGGPVVDVNWRRGMVIVPSGCLDIWPWQGYLRGQRVWPGLTDWDRVG